MREWWKFRLLSAKETIQKIMTRFYRRNDDMMEKMNSTMMTDKDIMELTISRTATLKATESPIDKLKSMNTGSPGRKRIPTHSFSVNGYQYEYRN
jgi:hypothetical protein